MNKAADLSPIDFRKQSATDGIFKDLNIGVQGLALIRGQTYNPEFTMIFYLWLNHSASQ